jgi:TolB-like protein/DNA-binding winged helix-turn-helix (wHTH) protein/Tfp pilus assembly protein PilF
LVKPASQLVQFADFEADLRAGELYREGKRIKLQDRPFKVLSILLETPQVVVTREELRQRIWPADTFVDFDHSLAVAVGKIREALEDSAETPRFIETVGRRGYRFLGVFPESAPDPVLQSVDPELLTRSELPTSRASRLNPGAVLVFCAMALTALTVWSALHFALRPSNATPPKISSLAVLPLENLSGDPGQEYFSDGITDELITDVARLSGVRVISRTSSARYKGTSKTIPQIGRELNVDGVIEGTVVRLGNRVRIRAKLIYAPADQYVWAEAYERDETDILALQAGLAREIAGKIGLELTAEQHAELAASSAVNPEVHELYLEGRYFWNKRDPSGLHKAVDYFQQAIAKDPNYAEAYVGLADAYGLLGMMPEAQAAAKKALIIDGDLAEAHTSLGLIEPFLDWNWDAGRAHFERAIALNPNYATAHHWYAEAYLMPTGHVDEALAELEKAKSLDPLSAIIATDFGKDLYLARRYDDAILQLRRALELDPNFVSAHNWLSDTFLEKGMYAEAGAELEKTKSFKEERIYVRQKAYLEARMGKRNEARKALEQSLLLSKGKDISTGAVALVYAALGDKDRTFFWLNKACATKSSFVTTLKFWSVFDPIRSDRRFADLLHRVGLKRE